MDRSAPGLPGDIRGDCKQMPPIAVEFEPNSVRIGEGGAPRHGKSRQMPHTDQSRPSERGSSWLPDGGSAGAVLEGLRPLEEQADRRLDRDWAMLDPSRDHEHVPGPQRD